MTGMPVWGAGGGRDKIAGAGHIWSPVSQTWVAKPVVPSHGSELERLRAELAAMTRERDELRQAFSPQHLAEQDREERTIALHRAILAPSKQIVGLFVPR